MHRCALYARFSSDRQKDTSVEDQLRDCRRHAEAQGWTVVAEFEDARISGTRNDRPGLMALLAALAERRFDTILCEHQDRLARDLEDIAGIYKRVRFHDARIVTLSRGELRQLDIGVQGSMDAEDLAKIADRVRRGQRGAVSRGQVPGGLCYGYDVVRQLDAKGELVRGLRKVNPEQARIVVRICEEYAGGRGTAAICRQLNQEGVPAPGGGEWRVSTIVGNAARKIGILHNPIYVGQLVYNRVRMVRDPDTRNRVSRPNPASELEIVEVPELRIVSDELWQRVQDARKAHAAAPLGRRRRARHLLSGLVRCGCCGESYAVYHLDRMRCTSRGNGGLCTNRRTIAVGELQRRVLAGLEEKLLSSDAVSLLVREYHLERAKRHSAEAAVRRRHEKRLAELDAAIARLVAAIAEGGEAFPQIKAGLAERSAERERLQAELAELDAVPVIALHPQIAEQYRARIRALIGGLQRQEVTAESSAGQIRELIGRVVIHAAAENGRDIEVITSLDAAVALAIGRNPRKGVAGTVVMVAEEGLEPPTRGL